MAEPLDIRSILSEAFKVVGHEWTIKGVVDAEQRLYTLSDDTKLISKVFELVTFPVVVDALRPHGVQVETEERQTVYPDLTIVLESPPPNKIAIDMKSTYRKGKDGNRASFTLGSYTAYMRPPFTKNIRYPYNEYLSHWIIGFVYTRVPQVRASVLTLEKLDDAVAPITDVELIIQEKWQIASDRPGSGNTANIGSVGRLDALRIGEGTFTQFGPRGVEVFEDYWRNYDRDAPRKYSNLTGYMAWRKENPNH